MGHWPQSMPLSTVGGWLACRGAGQLSTRYGKIEDMVVGLDVALADGTRDPHRRPPPPGRRPRPQPALRRLRGHARRHHRGPAAAAPGSRRHEQRAAYGVRLVRRRPRRLPPHPAPGRHARRAAALRRGRGRPQLPDRRPPRAARARRGRPRRWSTPPSRSSTRSAPRAERLDVGLVEQWMGHRNDVAALESLIAEGFVVDTMEITGPLVDAAPPSTRSTVDAIEAVPGTLAASAHQSHAYPDGACLYFTFAGQARPRRPRTPSTGPPGTPAPGPCWPAAARSATTTASASTGPASWPRRSAPPSAPWSPSRPRSTRTASSTPASSACPARSARSSWPGVSPSPR